jgi:hypothetical protein
MRLKTVFYVHLINFILDIQVLDGHTNLKYFIATCFIIENNLQLLLLNLFTYEISKRL